MKNYLSKFINFFTKENLENKIRKQMLFFDSDTFMWLVFGIFFLVLIIRIFE